MLFFVYPSRRISISSDASRYIISPLGCISSRVSVYQPALDDTMLSIDDIPQQVADDIQSLALIYLLTRIWREDNTMGFFSPISLIRRNIIHKTADKNIIYNLNNLNLSCSFPVCFFTVFTYIYTPFTYCFYFWRSENEMAFRRIH